MMIAAPPSLSSLSSRVTWRRLPADRAQSPVVVRPRLPRCPVRASSEPYPDPLEAVTEVGYRLGLKDVTREFEAPVPLAVEGRVPPDYDFTLFRNGPGKFSKVRNWIDAPGYVAALRVEKGQVSFQGRHVVTPEVAAELRAGCPLYGTYGERLPHGPWTLIRRRLYRSVANTSIVFHGGKLLALAEGGPPLRLDPHTLASGLPDDLGVLRPLDPLSAHFHQHPSCDELWNFGVSYDMHPLRGLVGTLRLYDWAQHAPPHLAYSHEMPFPGTPHDFFLTATKALIFLSPATLPSWPLGWVLGTKSLGESIAYRPELGTRVCVVDLASAAAGRPEAVWGQAEPMVLQHTVNAWDEDGGVTLDVCDAGDFARWTMWSELMTGDLPMRELATLRRLHVDAAGRTTPRPLPPAQMEFPVVSPRMIGRAHRYIWGLTWQDKGEPFFGVPSRFDTHTGEMQAAPMARGLYAGECLLVEKPDARAETDVYVLSIVLDSIRKRSTLVWYDGADLTLPPVASCLLPVTLPFGFHGTLVDNTALRDAAGLPPVA